MDKESKIYIAGHRGLVGSAIMRLFKEKGYANIITRTREELDLTNQQATRDFFMAEKPEFVFLVAAKVGGIMANQTYSADFIRENLSVQLNVIESAHLAKVKKLLFLGSSCIYPKMAPQPIKEEYFLTSPLEESNKAYAISKIAGITMCQSYNKQHGTNFISVMPTNLYGQGDNFDLESSHVLPSFIRRFHEVKINNEKKIILWGTGTAKREFLHVDDLAKACEFLMLNYNDSEIINIGTGKDISIAGLAEKVKKIVGFEGKIIWDDTKPDGTPRKLLDVSRINNLGWSHITELDDGLTLTYKWFKENYE